MTGWTAAGQRMFQSEIGDFVSSEIARGRRSGFALEQLPARRSAAVVGYDHSPVTPPPATPATCVTSGMHKSTRGMVAEVGGGPGWPQSATNTILQF